ncbi:MAG TPA: biotin/lipoyl-binding protein, partial [Symbiobacteriaceae bacterium]|nr:biotin/lipoyl-binding protein [Symbiobacteriaceae bacterium]
MKRRMMALAAAGLLLSGCGSLLPQEAAEPVVQMEAPQATQREVVTVERGQIESRLPLNISFGAQQQTPMYFRSGGRLRAVHVTPGQKVTEGTLLAELESGSLPHDLAMAELDLERARLNLEKAQSRIGFVDGPSEADLKKLELDLKQAELKLSRQQQQVADTRLYAPFAGQIVSVALAEGDTV